MDRSLAGRPGTGRLTRPPAHAARRRARRPASPARATRGIDRAIAGLLRPLLATTRLAVGCCSLVWRRRRLRIAVLALLIVVPLLIGGWLWLRHSSLVSVQKVRVSGAHGRQARAIDAALTSAARRMSTLDVHPAALRSAVASYPVVRDVRATPSFPHGLSIEVIEQPPVAALTFAGQRTAVAANGVVLGPALLSGSLPTITGSAAPAPGRHVRQAPLLGALTVLGAAPAPLAKTVARAFSGPKGLTLVMRSGLLAYFGDATRPHAKWISLARVLADPSSAGASYIDVRVPERPAAGYASGVAPSSGTGVEEGSSAGQGVAESNEALAERLAAAVGVGASSGISTGEHETSEQTESSSGSSGESGAEASETSPAPGG
jgi:cell division protein FtsQ